MYLNYIVGGVLLAAVGLGIAVAATTGVESNAVGAGFGFLLAGAGAVVAQVGVIAWGITVAMRHLPDGATSQATAGFSTSSLQPVVHTGDIPSRTVPSGTSGRSAADGGPLTRLSGPPNREPGWKDDPAAPGQQLRWWDGRSWLEEVRANET